MKLVLPVFTKILILVFAFSIFYFSWLPHGDFRDETYLPQWLINWSNTYYNLRTAIPFIFLSFLMALKYKVRNVLIICFVLVALAELGQYFIPKRFPSNKDVLYGMLGTVVGIVIARSLFKKTSQWK